MPPADTVDAPHPQLQRDCHWLGTLGNCQLLLHRNASLPWFILVPQGACTGIEQLPDADAQHLLKLIRHLSHFISTRFHSEKINIASIGNLVEQLHVHVIGRRQDDSCWPLPVWGHLPQGEHYTQSQIAELTRALEIQLHLVRRQEQAGPPV